jgi:hypothetical protein
LVKARVNIDFKMNCVTPAGTDPGAWKAPIEEFTIRKGEAVCIHRAGTDIVLVVTVNPDGSVVNVLIISINAQVCQPIRGG